MQAVLILLTIACYGGAIFLLRKWHTPIFLLLIIAGHIGSILSPLWAFLSQSTYATSFTSLYTIGSLHLLQPIVIASGWFYTIPACIVLVLYHVGWWTPSYISALVTYAACLLYHVIIEVIGSRQQLWQYSGSVVVPFGIAPWMLSTVMAALMSLALIYVVLLVLRSSWISMGLLLLPAPLLIAIAVRGLFGAPTWLSFFLAAEMWAASIGMACTVALIAWAVHIVSWGIARIDTEIIL